MQKYTCEGAQILIVLEFSVPIKFHELIKIRFNFFETDKKEFTITNIEIIIPRATRLFVKLLLPIIFLSIYIELYIFYILLDLWRH